MQSQQFRVASVAESGDGIYGVTRIAYNSSIYDAVERDIALTDRNISVLDDPPAAPNGLTGSEFLYQDKQTVHTGFDLGWQHDRVN